MGGGSLDAPSSGSRVIADAIRDLIATNEKLQKDNAKSTEKYLKITVLATIGSTILGVLIGKFVLS